MASIAENIRVIRETMAQAAKAAGREPSEVLLCAATKMNDAAAVREAVAAGVDCCGENRVQELTQKLAEGAYTGKPVHFIGHLQTNKVKQVVGKVDLIESSTGWSFLSASRRPPRSSASCSPFCWRSTSAQRRANPVFRRKKFGRLWKNGGFPALPSPRTHGDPAN